MTNLRNQLKIDEGVRNTPYKDSVGILTVGVGRNLQSVPFSDDEIELMLTNDINRALSVCNSLFPRFSTFTQDQQDALTNMAFNLGSSGLGKFKNMIIAINSNDWFGAKCEAEDSAWFHQVGQRAVRIINTFVIK